jgi:hypothetical protein
LLFNTHTNGQVLDKLFGAPYKTGLVVLSNGDTLKGKIVFNNDHNNYQILRFKDTIANEKTEYRPQDVKFFSIDSLFFYPKIYKNNWVFMCLLSDDSLKVYLYRYFMATQYVSGTYTSYIYEKPDGQYLQVLWNKVFPFKKKAGDFFSDYPELSEKIYNKRYKMEDLFIIAEEYNKWLKERAKK